MSLSRRGPSLKLPVPVQAEEKPPAQAQPVPTYNLEFSSELNLQLSNDVLQDIQELGSGNGGTVSLSKHKLANIVLARKVIPLSETETQLKLMVSELRTLHKCKHPCVVAFYGSFHHDGSINVLMEYMDLGSLDRVCKLVGGKIPESVAAKVALGICEGLDYLHMKMNILHRDIKPSNILLNHAGEIKLCDLGVSGELSNSIAKTFVGTSWYMAPERVRMLADYGRSSESWSTGLTLMEIVLGRFPFPPEGVTYKMTSFEVLTYIMQEEPPTLPDTFTPEFQDFVKQCLNKNFNVRPTPSQLLEHAFIQRTKSDNFDMVEWAKTL